jgi:FAD/FMN-containing dehydrogenase
MLSRRALLGGAAGTLVAGTTFGCAARQHTAGRPRSAPDWAALDSAIDGHVLLPADGADYTTASHVFNSRYDAARPAAVVTVRSVLDIQQALWFAAGNYLNVAPRAGGHSYTGASSASGAMVLDLRELPGGVTLDQALNRVTVTPATTLYAIQQTLAAAGRAIPTGTCPTVGAAGLTLGGGLGADSRHAGLTCDALVSVSVVLPSGKTVTASADRYPDLFWALRGGGGGSVGVVTKLTYRTFATADRDTAQLFFPSSAAAQMITGWRRWLTGADRGVWGLADLAADGTGELVCSILATCPAGSGPVVAAAITSAVGAAPVSSRIRTRSHLDLVLFLAGGSPSSQPRGFVAGSDVMSVLNDDAAAAAVTAMLAWPPGVGGASAILDTVDGAVDDVDPTGSAFPWRGQAAILQWYADTPSAPVESAANRWLSAAHQAVQDHSVGGYVNYLEPDTPAIRYFGANLRRLAGVREFYDPGRLLYSGLSF